MQYANTWATLFYNHALLNSKSSIAFSLQKNEYVKFDPVTLSKQYIYVTSLTFDTLLHIKHKGIAFEDNLYKISF